MTEQELRDQITIKMLNVNKRTEFLNDLHYLLDHELSGKLFILYGTGANGKTYFMNTLSEFHYSSPYVKMISFDELNCDTNSEFNKLLDSVLGYKLLLIESIDLFNSNINYVLQQLLQSKNIIMTTNINPDTLGINVPYEKIEFDFVFRQ
jgi:hypothetical protein